MRCYECVACNARYPLSHVQEWGRHAASDGLGRVAKCSALVPDHLGSGQVCGGALIAVDLTDPAEIAKVVPARPIAPGPQVGANRP